MNNEQHSETPRAFSSSDLKEFLERLGIAVTSETISLALAIDFAMRRGDRAAAEAAAQRLMDLFRTAPAMPGDGTRRVEYNPNALDPSEPDAKLILNALKLYANMQVTMQAVDPEEGRGEFYSDTLTDRMAISCGLPAGPLIKEFFKRIGKAFNKSGREGAYQEARGLIGHLVVDDIIEDTEAARTEMLNEILEAVVAAEQVVDQRGDVEGNEDFWGEAGDTEVFAQGDGGVDISLRDEEERREHELQQRMIAELERRELQLFQDLFSRENGLLDQFGLNRENAEDAALIDQLFAITRDAELLYGRPTRDGINQVTALRERLEQIAAQLAARQAGDTDEAAALATSINRQIVEEAGNLDRQIQAELPRLMQAVNTEMRQEARAAPTLDTPEDQPDPTLGEVEKDENPDPSKTTDPDIQKVAIALREIGMRDARQVAAQIAAIARKDGTLPVSEADMIEDLLTRAVAFNTAMDAFERKEKDAQKSAETTATPKAEDRDAETQPGVDSTDTPAPSLSDYRDELLAISFLQAEGNPDEARAAADRLAATLRELGGDFAGFDGAMVMKYVEREDQKANEARRAAAAVQTDNDDDEDPSDPASWFLSVALRKDDRSVQIYEGLVRAIIRGDKNAAGKLAKALANHILQLYRTNVTLVEMLTAIVNAARQEAKAKQEDEGSSDSGDSDDGSESGDESDDDDDDFSDRASWFLGMALDKDARSAEIYDALVRYLVKGDKVSGGKLVKALAAHILKLYKTNVTMPEMMGAIIKAARQDVEAQRDDASATSSDSGYNGDEDDSDNDDASRGGGAGAMAVDTEKSPDDHQSTYDMGTIKKVDWQSFLGLYSMDPDEGEAAIDVARLIVRQGRDSSGVRKSAKDLLTRSRKKVKGAKVKNHIHLVAAIEDALIKKTESKKVVKPLKFSDIPEDMSDDISV